MADDNERRAMKRSRFDQTERTGRSDGPGSRSSRFERRSRSPPPKSVHAARDRSPPRREPAIEDTKKSVIDKAAAAAAAAAKINAQINAKKGPQHVDVPPIRSAGSPTDGAASPSATGTVGGDIYIADGDYIKDIEVNDLRNRYTLTKGSTQKMVNAPRVLCPTDTPRLVSLLPLERRCRAESYLPLLCALCLWREHQAY